MQYKNVAVNRTDEIGFLILNRPETGNRLGREAFGEICQILQELDADDAVRVIIVKGAGENFCVGADVNEILFSTILVEIAARNGREVTDTVDFRIDFFD